MRKKMIAIIIFVFSCGLAHAEGQALDNATDEISAMDSICPGNWVLSNLAGWSVRNEDGVILPLSVDTAVFGCDGKLIALNADLSGMKVGVECAPSGVEKGLPNVLTVNIWCR